MTHPLQVQEGLTVNNGLVRVFSNTNDIILECAADKSVKVNINGVQQAAFSSSGVTLNLDGLTIANGLTVTAGGLTVTAGGITVAAGVANFNAAGLRTIQAVTNVHDTTPTAAELTTAFGNPATIGRGFIGTVDDNDGNTVGYLVWATDASYFFVAGTKAT